jgi:hypothetical protein
MTLRVALDALRADAASWEEVAAVTGRAGYAASTLNLSAAELSWASLPTGLLDTYTELQTKVVSLLDEAAGVYTRLSATLDNVAYQYESNDERAADELKGVWEVRE